MYLATLIKNFNAILQQAKAALPSLNSLAGYNRFRIQSDSKNNKAYIFDSMTNTRYEPGSGALAKLKQALQIAKNKKLKSMKHSDEDINMDHYISIGKRWMNEKLHT